MGQSFRDEGWSRDGCASSPQAVARMGPTHTKPACNGPDRAENLKNGTQDRPRSMCRAGVPQPNLACFVLSDWFVPCRLNQKMQRAIDFVLKHVVPGYFHVEPGHIHTEPGGVE